MRSPVCQDGDGAYVVSDVVVVGRLDQVWRMPWIWSWARATCWSPWELARIRVLLYAGRPNWDLLVTIAAEVRSVPGKRSFETGPRFPASSGWYA